MNNLKHIPTAQEQFEKRLTYLLFTNDKLKNRSAAIKELLSLYKDCIVPENLASSLAVHI